RSAGAAPAAGRLGSRPPHPVGRRGAGGGRGRDAAGAGRAAAGAMGDPDRPRGRLVGGGTAATRRAGFRPPHQPGAKGSARRFGGRGGADAVAGGVWGLEPVPRQVTALVPLRAIYATDSVRLPFSAGIFCGAASSRRANLRLLTRLRALSSSP